MKKIFLGIPLSNSVGTHILKNVSLQYPCLEQYKLRWQKVEQLHITMHFFGNVLPQEVFPLITKLKSYLATIPPINCHLSHIDHFPNTHSHIIAAHVEPEPLLLQLHANIEAIVEAAGFTRAERPYRPHITICRLNHHDKIKITPFNIEQQVTIKQMILYQTLPAVDGRQYIPLKYLSLLR